MALHQNPVGHRFYAWTRTKGAPSAGVNECVISAHGAQAQMNGMDKVPGDIGLIYYCPNGSKLNQSTIKGIVLGNLLPYEGVPARRSQDYQLFKLQGDDESETYDSIRASDNWITSEQNFLASQNAKLILEEATLSAAHGAQHRNAVMMRQMIAANTVRQRHLVSEMDVVTIRRRKHYSAPLLSDIIKELWKAGYAYKYFHCVFCRCPADGPSPSYKPLPLV